jgi:hypothetical protein
VLTLKQCIFQTRVQAAKTKSDELSIFLYSKPRFDFVVACLFTAIITGTIMGPVFVLTRFQNEPGNKKNFIILAFASAFAILCSACTTAKRHEIFAASAA